MADRPSLKDLLKATSRSFYLSLRALPKATRAAVGLAYLLARAADSVADTTFVAVDERLRLLGGLRAGLDAEGSTGTAAAWIESAQAASKALLEGERDDRGAGALGSAAERALIERLPDAARALAATAETDRRRIADVLRTIIEGMELDLRWFPAGEADAAAPPALASTGDLLRYCDHVAGSVGRFWTRIHLDHLPSLRAAPADRLAELGTRYGEALQLTNVLRDVPRDLDRGRCYLPASALSGLGLTTRELRDPVRRLEARRLVHELLRYAFEGYRAAAEYCLLLPRAEPRLRLATSLPLVIGLPTLQRIAAAPDPLDPRVTIKIKRSRVYALLAGTVLRVGSTGALRGWFRRLARPVARDLSTS